MSGKTDTWMPLYIGDYLADTQHLSTVEHGAYLLLLMTYWRIKGPLPDDDVKLARMVRLPLKQWKSIRSTIVEFFQIGDGQLRSSRADKEIEASQVKSDKARASALERHNRDRANAEQSQSEGNANGDADDMLAGAHPPASPSPSPSPVSSRRKQKEPKDSRSLDESISSKFWESIDAKSPAEIIDAVFDRWFWTHYPERKGPKQPARLAFHRALKHDNAANIIVGAGHYLAKREGMPKEDWKFTAHATTWLNGQRWRDELEEMNAALEAQTCA